MSSSIKLHTPATKKRAIAHFYRPCIVYPNLDPYTTLSVGNSKPAAVRTEGQLGWSLMGDNGKLSLKGQLQRQTWVAGQKVWAEVDVHNLTSKKVSRCFSVLYSSCTAC